MKKQIHKYARILPPMTADEYERLRDDIAARGVVQKILLYEDKILDGIHRQRACEETGQEPRYETYKGDEPLSMVIALNVNRRNLTPSQRACLAVEIEPRLAKEAKERQRAAGGDRRSGYGLRAISENGDKGMASDAAAHRLGVKGRSVRRVKRIKDKDPNLFRRIQDGELAAATAERVLLGDSNGKPKERKHPRSVTGRRAGGRRKQLRKMDVGKLQKTQRLVVDLWGALEGVDLGEEADLDGYAISLLLDLHDDLVALSGWCDRSLHQVQGRLADVDVRAKIKVLRDSSGRTDAEAELANEVADRLEAKMERRLVE